MCDNVEAGEKALICLSSGNLKEILDQLQCRQFMEKVAKSSKYVEAQVLPPTSAAAKYHNSLQVFMQIQEWKAIQLDPLEWGWEFSKVQLVAKQTDLPPAPQNSWKSLDAAANPGARQHVVRVEGMESSVLPILRSARESVASTH